MNITERDKKFLSFGGVIAGCIVFYMLIYEPFVASHQEIKTQIVKKQNLLSQYRTISANIAAQGGKLDLFKNKYHTLKGKLLSGNTSSIAAAELQKNLQHIAQETGVTIDSIRVSETKNFEYFVQIPVEVTIKCRMRNLNNFLYKVENNEKFLTLSRLIIKTVDIKNPLDIGVRVEVSGFISQSLQ